MTYLYETAITQVVVAIISGTIYVPFVHNVSGFPTLAMAKIIHGCGQDVRSMFPGRDGAWLQEFYKPVVPVLAVLAFCFALRVL